MYFIFVSFAHCLMVNDRYMDSRLGIAEFDNALHFFSASSRTRISKKRRSGSCRVSDNARS